MGFQHRRWASPLPAPSLAASVAGLIAARQHASRGAPLTPSSELSGIHTAIVHGLRAFSRMSSTSGRLHSKNRRHPRASEDPCMIAMMVWVLACARMTVVHDRRVESTPMGCGGLKFGALPHPHPTRRTLATSIRPQRPRPARCPVHCPRCCC